MLNNSLALDSLYGSDISILEAADPDTDSLLLLLPESSALLRDHMLAACLAADMRLQEKKVPGKKMRPSN